MPLHDSATNPWTLVDDIKPGSYTLHFTPGHPQHRLARVQYEEWPIKPSLPRPARARSATEDNAPRPWPARQRLQ